jgi:hypothetical protein
LIFTTTLTASATAAGAAKTASGEALIVANAFSCSSSVSVNNPRLPVIVCSRNARRVCPTSVNAGISFTSACSSTVNSGPEVSLTLSFMSRIASVPLRSSV